MSDYYEASAEFIDMMIEPWWRESGTLLAEALDGLGSAGPIVDAGAGSGRAVQSLAPAHPEAEFLAVEPSAGMRSALFARIVASDDLRRRVTVLPTGLLDAELPDTVGAFVLMNVLGHFPPAERARVWDLLADRLAPSGRAVVNLAPPFSPVSVPRVRMADVPVGRARYEGWAQAEPAGEDKLTWTMTYRVTGPGFAPVETVVSYDWWTVTPERLAAEAAGHGLDASPHGPADSGFFVVRRA